MITSAKTGACYTGLIGATVLSEVRAISGLPSRLYLYNSDIMILYWISKGLREFWEKAIVLRLAA
jgi:hypothetical protein